jgi:hypothetical protein
MPLYTVLTEEDTVSDTAKAKIAEEITRNVASHGVSMLKTRCQHLNSCEDLVTWPGSLIQKE